MRMNIMWPLTLNLYEILYLRKVINCIGRGFSGQATELLSASAANAEESSIKKESDGMFELLLCHLQGKFQVDSYYSPGNAL